MSTQPIHPIAAAPQLQSAHKLEEHTSAQFTSTPASEQLCPKPSYVRPWEDRPINHSNAAAPPAPFTSPVSTPTEPFIPYSFEVQLPDDFNNTFNMPDAYALLYNQESILGWLP